MLTQDTLVVTALYKALRDKFQLPARPAKRRKGKKPDAEVHIWKLFARHMPLKEHQDALAVKPQRPVINIMIGTPNRIRQLAQTDTIKLSSKKLKTIVFDCKPNQKGFTLFETHETRDDTFGVLLYAQKELLARKLKLYLA